MATLTVREIDTTPLDVTAYMSTLPDSAATGDKFVNTGREFLWIKNGAASPITVTIEGQVKCNQGNEHDFTATVTNGKTLMIGPFNKRLYTKSDTYSYITYSSTATITLAVVRLKHA